MWMPFLLMRRAVAYAPYRLIGYVLLLGFSMVALAAWWAVAEGTVTDLKRQRGGLGIDVAINAKSTPDAVASCLRTLRRDRRVIVARELSSRQVWNNFQAEIQAPLGGLADVAAMPSVIAVNLDAEYSSLEDVNELVKGLRARHADVVDRVLVPAAGFQELDVMIGDAHIALQSGMVFLGLTMLLIFLMIARSIARIVSSPSSKRVVGSSSDISMRASVLLTCMIVLVSLGCSVVVLLAVSDRAYQIYPWVASLQAIIR